MDAGQTKEAEPIAILLRSGDALVLSGAARTCFHGMPRLLHDQAPEKALNPRLVPPSMVTIAKHLQTCRVNISLRSVASGH